MVYKILLPNLFNFCLVSNGFFVFTFTVCDSDGPKSSSALNSACCCLAAVKIFCVDLASTYYKTKQKYIIKLGSKKMCLFKIRTPSSSARSLILNLPLGLATRPEVICSSKGTFCGTGCPNFCPFFAFPIMCLN